MTRREFLRGGPLALLPIGAAAPVARTQEGAFAAGMAPGQYLPMLNDLKRAVDALVQRTEGSPWR